VIVAENLAGSEAVMAERMTATAQALGMTSTRFAGSCQVLAGGRHKSDRRSRLRGNSER
jgi:hypothetical protein